MNLQHMDYRRLIVCLFGTGNPLLWYGTDTRIGPRSEDAAECGSRFEDATVVEVVPVAAAMDLLA